MLKKLFEISTLVPLFFLLIGWAIVGYESYQSLMLETSWVRSEFYITSLLNFVFIFILTTVLHFCLKSTYWTRHYLMSIGIMSALIFYGYVSLSGGGSDFPILAGLLIVAILFIIPGLFVLRFLVFLIERYQIKRLENTNGRTISNLEKYLWLLSLCIGAVVLFFTIVKLS